MRRLQTERNPGFVDVENERLDAIAFTKTTKGDAGIGGIIIRKLY
jgi:hypothetical protein